MDPGADLQDDVLLLECNLDDMTGEELGFALERMFDAGALDAWFTPIYMKKNRPGVILSVLCRPEDGGRLRERLLRETTTLGVRWRPMQRQIAERRSISVETPWGTVRCKCKLLGDRLVSIKPEHEDCAEIARSQDLPIMEVTLAARRAAHEALGI